MGLIYGAYRYAEGFWDAFVGLLWTCRSLKPNPSNPLLFNGKICLCALCNGMSNSQHLSQVFLHTDDDGYVRRPRKRLSLGTCLKHAGARANTDSLPLGTGPGGQSPRCCPLQTPEPKHVVESPRFMWHVTEVLQ